MIMRYHEIYFIFEGLMLGDLLKAILQSAKRVSPYRLQPQVSHPRRKYGRLNTLWHSLARLTHNRHIVSRSSLGGVADDSLRVRVLLDLQLSMPPQCFLLAYSG
jgi:hypothetical protein